MSLVKSGNNIIYTYLEFVEISDFVIERTDITEDTIDYTPDASEIVSVLGEEQQGLVIEFYIYNTSTDYTITLAVGPGFTMKPGPTDLIQPNSIKRYYVLVKSNTESEIFNCDLNGQPIKTKTIMTNKIIRENLSEPVEIYNDSDDIKLGSGQPTKVNISGDLSVYGKVFDFTAVAEIFSQINYTYSVGQILGGFIKRNGGNETRYDYFPNASNIVAAIPDVSIGSSFLCFIQNSGNRYVYIYGQNGVTVSGDTNVIFSGSTMPVLFVVTNTNPGNQAVTAYLMGILFYANNGVASSITEIDNKNQLPYNILESDVTINVDTDKIKQKSEIILPQISTVGQKRYFITDSTGDADDYNIIVKPSGSDTIMGTSQVIINSKYSSISVYNNGTNNWLMY